MYTATTKATNSTEAKAITDRFVSGLTLEDAVRIFRSYTKQGHEVGFAGMGINLAHTIGAGSYYYDCATNTFPSEVIERAIVNLVIDAANTGIMAVIMSEGKEDKPANFHAVIDVPFRVAYKGTCYTDEEVITMRNWVLDCASGSDARDRIDEASDWNICFHVDSLYEGGIAQCLIDAVPMPVKPFNPKEAYSDMVKAFRK